MRDLIGRTLGHYRIVEKIGAGGMGVVYRAHDDRLDRDVAIKVLPEEVAGDPDRLRRFEREAKAVAALSHPNILEIFDFDTEGDVAYSVTELLEGETLREHLHKEHGPLPWRRVQEIGAAVASGLGAAHGKGVVHRDIKPSNLFLCSDGRVKILDFGLAATHELVDPEAETGSIEVPLTREDKVLGTVGYMSPEQVRGETADHRTDIFALGCVLYEMLTGHRAFKRETTAEIMTAILREEARSFSDSGVQVPPEVAKAVEHCLEKKPEQRYQSASDLAFELENILGDPSVPSRTEPEPSRGRRRIALIFLAAVLLMAVGITVSFQVLRTKPAQPAQTDVSEPRPDRNLLLIVPFENRTGDPELDALGFEATSRIGDSLRGQTIKKLIASLGVEITQPVVSRDSPALLDLASSRNAGTVLSGSISRQHKSLRLEARLTDALQQQAGPAIESVVMSIETPEAAIEELQRRVLALVYWQLSTVHTLLATPKPPRWEAIQAWQARTADHALTDISPYLRAMEIDPDFHALWWAIAVRYANAGMYPESKSALDRLDEHTAKLSPYGRHMSAASRAHLEGNLSAVYFQYHQASSREPRADLRRRIAESAMAIGRPLEAVELLRDRLAERTDLAPPSPNYYSKLAEAYSLLNRHEESLEVATKGRTVFPSSVLPVWGEAAALAALGRLEEVDRLVNDCQTIRFTYPEGAGDVMGMAVTTLRRYGYHEEALTTAERAVEWYRGRSGAAGSSWGYRVGFADAMYRAQRWEEARTLYLSLADEAGDIRSVLRSTDFRPLVFQARLGMVAAQLGDRQEAERISTMLGGIEGFTFGLPEVYRASIASVLGDHERAIELVKQALAAGRPLNALYWENYDLDSLWDEPEFQELVKPKG